MVTATKKSAFFGPSTTPSPPPRPAEVELGYGAPVWVLMSINVVSFYQKSDDSYKEIVDFSIPGRSRPGPALKICAFLKGFN